MHLFIYELLLRCGLLICSFDRRSFCSLGWTLMTLNGGFIFRPHMFWILARGKEWQPFLPNLGRDLGCKRPWVVGPSQCFRPPNLDGSTSPLRWESLSLEFPFRMRSPLSCDGECPNLPNHRQQQPCQSILFRFVPVFNRRSWG